MSDNFHYDKLKLFASTQTVVTSRYRTVSIYNKERWPWRVMLNVPIGDPLFYRRLLIGVEPFFNRSPGRMVVASKQAVPKIRLLIIPFHAPAVFIHSTDIVSRQVRILFKRAAKPFHG